MTLEKCDCSHGPVAKIPVVKPRQAIHADDVLRPSDSFHHPFHVDTLCPSTYISTSSSSDPI